ncbi:MAG: alpha-mannosidase [Clostridia bacterium]|nr:alpha-mannosidase [Clostridia bacterium]
MKNKLRKIKRYLRLLEKSLEANATPVSDIFTCPTGYKTDNSLPDLAGMTPYTQGDFWGSGWDTHAWFRFTVTPTAENSFLRVETERKKGWDADNPQFLLYIDGKIAQGLDINHRDHPLETGKTVDVALYAYTGPKVERAQLFVDVVVHSPAIEGLYYDIRYPAEMLEYLDAESAEYAAIVDYLWQAVSMLDLYEMGSADFLASTERARDYLAREFYGNYCQPQRAVTVGIGHTHIDCAWKWTLRQTREKVQRSFSTVLELMRRYPEYKFMSSQAFLYQNLKEEAPELYREVAERIKEGRWECEGAMWVEADCNLSSGESLVRQVLYGKNFFLDEFGVENRVLWLPDVFGYSAAMPQILRKSGVDWFVTSKISWNDTNRMPYDTFRWRGIDGTEINTQFITAQDTKGGPSERYCTYVGNTGAKMVAGTHKRYTQKHLHNEALLTFGYGDGGGGPTPTHLELAARGAKGIPGGPMLKIDFAGDYLKRLEKSMEKRRDIPTWQGELYLEFHRGTYTTMARNKRSNRQSEFLYQDAELLAITAGALWGEVFPQAVLHHGWEMILTNQFHDIIPGSSIKEVYDQSDIDYAEIKAIGDGIVTDLQKKVANGIEKRRGYVVFNPHSFTTEGLVRIGGKVVRTKGKIPSKGYLVTNDFIAENRVRLAGHTVETDLLRVSFDEHWQIASVFDKVVGREVLQSGAVGNELRAYADHPDTFDAWEWQAYSAEEYRVITDVTRADWVEDGVRSGLQIVRPFMHSTITQTVWFYDDTTRIDFETVADWHNRHQMLKVAFPVDINADKATYEIQFGTVERPTHKNTSWDAARFEVCAHKYADLSEGGYGVALLNDCKYGHDIHDGVMQLSLLRSPTDPNPEADQGEIPVTYSLMPHQGCLSDTDVVRDAYYLNYPMTALPATGLQDVLPPSFSALSVDAANVICETVKKAEKEDATILRLYECQNKRTTATLTLGIPAREVWLTDMMERKLQPLPVENGRVTLPFRGFEIHTLKVKA